VKKEIKIITSDTTLMSDLIGENISNLKVFDQKPPNHSLQRTPKAPAFFGYMKLSRLLGPLTSSVRTKNASQDQSP